jgi:hypothetical protein
LSIVSIKLFRIAQRRNRIATRKNANVAELPSGSVKTPFFVVFAEGRDSVVVGIRVLGTITKRPVIVKRNVTIYPLFTYRTLV